MTSNGQRIARKNAKKFTRWVLERYAAGDWQEYVR